MKNFSMLEQALETAKSSRTAELGQVPSVSRRFFDENETFTFTCQVPCLEYISLMIENAVLLKTDRRGRVYAGFEKLSRMQGVIDRYLRMADVCERLYVFGVADWKPPRHPNMKLVTFPEDSKLAREWFVIAESSALCVALVARDEDGFGAPVLEERTFRSFKSHNPLTVAKLASAAEDLVDLSLAG